MNEFKVGDLVKVANWGSQYSSHRDWFLAHMSDAGFEAEWAIRYAFDNALYEIESLGDFAKQKTYQILYIDGIKYLISIADTDSLYTPVYLIHEKGLKRTPRKMTLKEIEKELGYEVELVAEDKKNE